MTKFALLADIHEQLRFGKSTRRLRMEAQFARLKTADDAILLYQFFYPIRKSADPTQMIAYEAALYYDVVKDILPDEEPWMALASESSNSGSRDYDCGYVRALLNVEKSFTEIAKQFNEKEARLLWRWATKAKPVMSKRTFFGVLARLHGLPIHLLQANMNITMIAKIYSAKDSILGLERWWEYDNAPAPMRWKAYTALAPPEEKHFAVVVPEGQIVYAYKGHLRNRAGVRLPTAYNPYKDDSDSYYELSLNGEEVTVLDYVYCDSPTQTFLTRSQKKRLSMNTDDHWNDIVAELDNPDVRCVRLIKSSQEFKPDAIGGYVIHADRTKVFLRAEATQTKGIVGLNAIDGVDEFIRVANTTETMQKIPDESCVVVEVAAVRVSAKGQLINFTVVGVRDDLGIGDVTQFTELVERGME